MRNGSIASRMRSQNHGIIAVDHGQQFVDHSDVDVVTTLN